MEPKITEVETVITRLNQLIRARKYTAKLNNYLKTEFYWTAAEKLSKIKEILNSAKPSTIIGVAYYYVEPNGIKSDIKFLKYDIATELLNRENARNKKLRASVAPNTPNRPRLKV